MSVDHNNHDPTSVGNSENYEEVFTRLLTKYINHTAPRLFALCRECCEDAEDWVFAWGAAFDDSAVLFQPNGRLAGTFSTADNALNLLSRIQDLCLIWVNPTVCSQPDAVAIYRETENLK